jgi:hypothetical protein
MSKAVHFPDDVKITELSDEVASTSLAAEKEKEKEKPQLINGSITARIDKKINVAGLDVKSLNTEYLSRKLEEPVYLIPLHLSDDGGCDDQPMQLSFRGVSVIDRFCVVSESELSKVFPSLVRYANWKKMFAPLKANDEKIAEIKKALATEEVLDLYIPEIDAHLMPVLIHIVTADLLKARFGPIMS